MVMMDERNAYQPQGSAAIPPGNQQPQQQQQQQQPQQSQGIGNGAQTINPTAQQVGQEFVRQYYTMFSQKPDQLHRFYTEASTFVRGVWDTQRAATEDQQQSGGIAGERVRLTGQTAVQNYMLNLKPRSGHARIHMVEAQPSHSDAVVVQVCGELRINEGPFRRFFQTFVLVPSGNRRFSVLNDIFVFQEEVSEVEVDEEQSPQVNGTAHLDEVVPPAPAPSVTTGPFPAAAHAAPMPPRDYSTSPAIEEPHTPSSLGNSQYTSPEPPPIFAGGNQKEPAPPPPSKTEGGARQPEAPTAGHPAEPVAPVEPPPPPPGPQTWAGIAKNLPNQRKDGASSAQGMAPPPSSVAPVSPPVAATADRPPSGAPSAAPHAAREYVNQARSNKLPPVHRASIGSDAGGSTGSGYVRGPWDTMPKEQQLFIRVPPSMAEKDVVYKFFAPYGKILGVKVLQSSGPPAPEPNQRSFDPGLTHFAFVVFEKEESAKSVLAAYDKDHARFKSEDGIQLSVVAKTDKPKFDVSRGGAGGGDGYYQQRSSPGPGARSGGGGAYQRYEGSGSGTTRGRGRGGGGEYRGGRGSGHFSQSGGAGSRATRDTASAGGGGRQ